MLTNKLYDFLKWVALCLLPGLGALYFALSKLWAFPFGEEVLGTLVALETFLGVLLGISTKNYKGDGSLIIDTSDPSTDRWSLDLDTPLNNVYNTDTITLCVKRGELCSTASDISEYTGDGGPSNEC